MNKQAIKDSINKSLSHDPAAMRACLTIYDYLQNNEIKNLNYITFNNLREISRVKDNVLFKAINYLTGQSLPLLSIGYEYVYENEIYTLTEEDVGSILKDDVLFLDGYPVNDWKEKTFIFFYASKELEGLLK